MKELNCMNCCIGDFKNNLCDCDGEFCRTFKGIGNADDFVKKVMTTIRPEPKWIPSAQTEPLTNKEQRIFLAAMAREEKVCEEVDRNYVREPYEDSLVSVCREIKRKVKGALWT